MSSSISKHHSSLWNRNSIFWLYPRDWEFQMKPPLFYFILRSSSAKQRMKQLKIRIGKDEVPLSDPSHHSQSLLPLPNEEALEKLSRFLLWFNEKKKSLICPSCHLQYIRAPLKIYHPHKQELITINLRKNKKIKLILVE